MKKETVILTNGHVVLRDTLRRVAVYMLKELQLAGFIVNISTRKNDTDKCDFVIHINNYNEIKFRDALADHRYKIINISNMHNSNKELIKTLISINLF